MKRFVLLAVALTVCFATNASAVMRTIDVVYSDPPSVGFPVDEVAPGTFNLDAGAFDTDAVANVGGEISAFQLIHGDALDAVPPAPNDGSAPYTNALFTLTSLNRSPNGNWRFDFENAASEPLRLILTDAATPLNSDLPDGVYMAQTNDGLAGNRGSTTSLSVTIGTAIPEPSAFAFGALAITVVGVGRWTRRRLHSGE